MSMLRRSRERLRAFFRGQQLDLEFDEELQAHLELATEEHLREGMTLPEARRLARIKLGGIEPAKELHRETRGLASLDGFLQDIRYGVRGLRRSPGFAAISILSLALGIGANTAIFTMIESTLLRPISVKDPGQLRLLTWSAAGGGWVAPNLGYVSPTYGWIYDQELEDHAYIHAEFAPPVYQHFLRNNTLFDSLFGFKELGRVTAVVDGNAEPLNCFVVSGDFYRGLQVSPVIGRTIGPADDVAARKEPVVVISYDYWTRRFGRDPSVLGKTITLNQIPVTIVGVNPEYFTGVVPGGHFEVWAPLNLSGPIGGHSLLDEDKIWSMPLMGRLKSGVTDQQAQSAFDLLFQQKIDADYAAGAIGWMLKVPTKRPHLNVVSGARGIDYITPHYNRTLLALWALAGLVLLIAGANVANLLLAKSATRQREISLRLALGASRSRIAGQLLAEGLPLAALSGVAGFIIGYAARNAIPALLANPWRANPFEASIDSRVLLVALAITMVAGLFFSLAPALQSRRVEWNDALKNASRSTASLPKLRAVHLLVVLQVALSVLLLAGAGLCIKTFMNLRSVALGVKPEGVTLFTLDPPRAIRQSVRSVDSNLAVTDVRTELEQIESELSQERLMASLAAIFGGLALLLAAIGIYGVVAYAVARRTNEIGIRVALGARPTGVAWMVLRETMLLATAGAAIGVPFVLALNPLLDHTIAPAYRQSFAYGMKPNDPLPIVIAVLVLAVVGFVAGYFPARRAAKVDPMVALRHD